MLFMLLVLAHFFWGSVVGVGMKVGDGHQCSLAKGVLIWGLK